jgi:hypothetical protein
MIKDKYERSSSIKLGSIITNRWLKMNMKEEVEHSNPLKGLSQKTSLLIVKFKIYSRLSRLDDDQKIGYFKAYTFMNLSAIWKNRHFFNFTFYFLIKFFFFLFMKKTGFSLKILIPKTQEIINFWLIIEYFDGLI